MFCDIEMLLDILKDLVLDFINNDINMRIYSLKNYFIHYCSPLKTTTIAKNRYSLYSKCNY